ncbi:hypothetical protein ARAM_006192 [Aspergillus rambellii]|uniref:Fungal-type protein kinase domain-containing protein n=1 Tax=Aspergillus rambellii TaxID=308745 RepID=A0A0F8UBM5_9EURO|nr:hypothetical protein ARAM_006192 [Aspergillus rambellii]
MNQKTKTDIIKANPIADGLASFRDTLLSRCKDAQLPCSAASLNQLHNDVLKDLSVDLVTTLLSHPASRTLPSAGRGRTLLGDLSKLNSTIDSGDFDVKGLIPLFSAVFTGAPDEVVWDNVYAVVTESTPSPRLVPFLSQTSYLHTISSFVNSSEQRKHVDAVLKGELGSIYVGVSGFYEAYFGGLEGLEDAAATVFRRCHDGHNPLFTDKGWRNWPETAKEKEVLDWLSAWVDSIRNIANEQGFAIPPDRMFLAQPHRSLEGSTADRKIDLGIVRASGAASEKYHWSQVLVIGELKSNPKEDLSSKTWRDLGRYAREVLTTQDSRRFALGFTLCGSTMRLWEFDRIGAIASSSFDIHKDGLAFVSAMLGFLRMNDDELGYDPSIMFTSDGRRFIKITRNGQSENLILDSLIRRSPCIAGRATTCWKAHREGDKSCAPLVIKDSWQYPEREVEGELLQEATEKGVIYVARYYYHETVHVNGQVDSVCDNIRKGLDITQSTNYRPIRPEGSASDITDKGGIGRPINAGCKRSSSHSGATLLPNKRICSRSPCNGGRDSAVQNRVHRRVIIRDCYESLLIKTGLLQGDISTGNLIINENNAFLIDLDLAIRENREQPPGARGKTGTRAFMAIGLLLGEKHSFMHDLESFFWVLFWICIHFSGEAEKVLSRVVPEFDKWNYVSMDELAKLKKGTIAHEGDFIRLVNDNFTDYYQPLGPWVNRLRKVVFPGGGRWEKEDRKLYARMKQVLQTAKVDPKLLETRIRTG